ncbi:glycoside hydrolase family 78 protein [Micromonospora sp. NPDC003776]
MVGRTRKGLLALAPPAAAAADSVLRVGELKTEHAHNRLGVDATHSRLGWTLASSERAQRQSACQIVVASSRSRLDLGAAAVTEGSVPAAEATGVRLLGRGDGVVRYETGSGDYHSHVKEAA